MVASFVAHHRSYNIGKWFPVQNSSTFAHRYSLTPLILDSHLLRLLGVLPSRRLASYSEDVEKALHFP